jgi:hypothetical protein
MRVAADQCNAGIGANHIAQVTFQQADAMFAVLLVLPGSTGARREQLVAISTQNNGVFVVRASFDQELHGFPLLYR